MNGRGHGQLRRSQVITTFGPGALIDLPNESAIVPGSIPGAARRACSKSTSRASRPSSTT